MSLPLRPKMARIIATFACLVALATYSAFAPATSAEIAPVDGCCTCAYGSGTYAEGACRSGQACVCIHFDNGCQCSWTNGCG